MIRLDPMSVVLRSKWKESALALCFFTLATLAFLWPAIARFHEASYTSADLSQAYALTTIAGPVRPGNQALSDPVVEMLPWLEFDWNELREGRLPTWNPWNGAGVPHLANYQSAVFSPFSLPFYFAPLKWALLITAFFKLAAIGCFTFLFLRALGIGFAAACAGGTIFEFGGHNVLLLGYPHSAVVVGFPAALWVIERAWQAVEADPATRFRSCLPWASGFALSVAVMLVAGAPETAAFAIGVSALYAVARALGVARAKPKARAACVRSLVGLGLFSVLGLAIAAVQVLPFFEYAARSTLIETRANGFDGLRQANWPLQFFPDLLGNPAQFYRPRPDLPYPNYEAANTAYFGPLAVLFAIAASGLFFRRRTVRFFVWLSLVWVLCAFDFDWMRPVMIAFTAVTHAPINRSQFVPLMGLAVLAAVAIDELRPAPTARRWAVLIGTCAFATAALWLAWRGADRLVEVSFQGAPPAGQKYRVPLHLAFMTRTFAAGAVCFACLAVVRARWLRALLTTAIMGLLFAQSGWLLRGFNSLSRDEHVFPRTPAIETLAATIGKERLQVIGEDTLPPHTNMPYQIASIAVYDALWVGDYDRLYRMFFKSEDNWRRTLWTTDHALKTLGVRYLLARDNWPRLNPGIAIEPGQALPLPVALECRPAADIEQTFQVESDGLDCVAVALGAEEDPIPAFVELSLEDALSGERIAVRRLDTHSLRAGLPKITPSLFAHDLRFVAPTGWIQLRFLPQPSSAGRSYRLRLRAKSGDWKQGFLVWTVPDEAPDARSLQVGGEKLEARLCMDWGANLRRDLEPLATFDPFTLYRFKPGLGRFWIARQARLAPDAESALGMTLSRDHDPNLVAILEGVAADNLRDLGKLEFNPSPRVIEETARRIALEVDVPREAWMVAAISWYPGWKARVDGQPVELAKANYAFLGVPLPAGKHVVELEFESTSVRIGAWISGLSLLLLAGFTGLALRGRARAQGV